MPIKAYQLYDKINNNIDTFIVFGLNGCPYCTNAIKYLKDNKYKHKYYEMNKYRDIFIKILKDLNDMYPTLEINMNHETFPVIFYNKKFIGGFDDLKLFRGAKIII